MPCLQGTPILTSHCQSPCICHFQHCFQLLFYLQEWEELSLKPDSSTSQPFLAMELNGFLSSTSTFPNKGQWLRLSVGTSSPWIQVDPPQADPQGFWGWILLWSLEEASRCFSTLSCDWWLAAPGLLNPKSTSSSSRVLSPEVPTAPESSHFLTQKPRHESSDHLVALQSGCPDTRVLTLFTTGPFSLSPPAQGNYMWSLLTDSQVRHVLCWKIQKDYREKKHP